MDESTIKSLKTSLRAHARAINIPEGAAEDFIKRALSDASKALKNKTVLTDNDLKRVLYKELKKYNADLAYVYKNCDKII